MQGQNRRLHQGPSRRALSFCLIRGRYSYPRFAFAAENVPPEAGEREGVPANALARYVASSASQFTPEASGGRCGWGYTAGAAGRWQTRSATPERGGKMEREGLARRRERGEGVAVAGRGGASVARRDAATPRGAPDLASGRAHTAYRSTTRPWRDGGGSFALSRRANIPCAELR